MISLRMHIKGIFMGKCMPICIMGINFQNFDIVKISALVLKALRS